MSRDDDESVFAEPHQRGGRLDRDPSEARAATKLARERDEQHEHTVWDEPSLSPELALDRRDPDVWRRWYQRGRTRTSAARSWWITLGVALLAGPWAVLGVLWAGSSSIYFVMAVVVFGPLTEEVMKVAAPLILVETRPYLFRSAWQIAVCAGLSGLAFAVIENLIYLNIYIPNPPDGLVQWRWTVCVALHTTCSTIAGLGVMAVWRRSARTGARPEVGRALTFVAVAFALHATYNGLATLIEALGDPVW